MDKFGAALSIKKSSVSRLESGVNIPSPQTIALICREFGINESWLRTGEGDMKMLVSRAEEIADIMNRLLADEPKSFRLDLIRYVSRMSAEQLDMLKDMIKELADKVDTLE